MVSIFSALLGTTYTMKNTIDDADYIIDRIVLIVIIQCATISGHFHSIVNKPFLSFIFNDLFFLPIDNTMKNTMLRNFLK